MAHLIDKDALVVEIEKLKGVAHKGISYHQSRQNVGLENELSTWEHLESAFFAVLKIIDTLEVKEVDLEIKQRMEECPYRQVGCTMYEGYILECRGACSWVVDCPKLKELKA